MNYKELVEKAQKSGMFTEKQMWASVESMSDMLCVIKEKDPKAYWSFLREQHGIMFGCHYGEEFAMHDVSQISYTDREGKKHTGAYWTCEQIEEATKGMTFPSGTTKYDKWVAFNVFYSDCCKVLTDEQILKAAYQFFFADEDWSGKNKIWAYMAMVHEQ